MNLDKFFGRYPGKGYTCFNLACDIWKELTGQDISEAIDGISNRRAGSLKRFRELDKPESPCIAFFRGEGHRSHCGIYLEGRIIHLAHEGTMAMRPEVVMLCGFKTVKYYAVNDNP